MRKFLVSFIMSLLVFLVSSCAFLDSHKGTAVVQVNNGSISASILANAIQTQYSAYNINCTSNITLKSFITFDKQCTATNKSEKTNVFITVLEDKTSFQKTTEAYTGQAEILFSF